MLHYIFYLIFIIEYSWNRLTLTCNSFKGEILIILHHLVSFYSYLGAFFFNNILHLLFMIFLILHWTTNGNKCFLTELTNKYCGLNINTNFNHIYKLLNIYVFNIDYIVVLFLILFDIYNIIKN